MSAAPFLAKMFAGCCMAYHETDRPWRCLDPKGHQGYCDGAEGHTPDGSCCNQPDPTTEEMEE